MKIVLEGVDGSGKSTLVEKIKHYFPSMNFKVVHCTRETPNNFKYFEELIESPDNIIFDRFCYGQFIYQTEEERIEKGWLTLDQLRDLELIMNRKNVVFVYVNCDPEVCLHNCKLDRDDSHYTLDYIKSLQSKYKSFLSSRMYGKFLTYENDYDPINEKAHNADYGSLPKIVAVDFDGCLFESKGFPEFGRPNEKLIDELVTGKYASYKKILWTSRNGKSLEDAVNACAMEGLYFDAINENIPEVKDITGGDTRKVFADEYLDDKAVKIVFEE